MNLKFNSNLFISKKKKKKKLLVLYGISFRNRSIQWYSTELSRMFKYSSQKKNYDMKSAVYKSELQLLVKPRCQADTLGQICQSKDKAIVSCLTSSWLKIGSCIFFS